MENKSFLSFVNLNVFVAEKHVLRDVSFFAEKGSVHALMGPNGSGKSSLAYALAGHPSYKVEAECLVLGDISLMNLSPCDRARAGIFLAFQHPCEVPGVSVFSFLKEAYAAVTGVQLSVDEFRKMLLRRFEQLGIDSSFESRGFGEGFSGGEKKKLEIVQLLLLRPKVAILDEIDSGLDIDALKVVAAGIEIARQENSDMCIVLITHYQRILHYIQPDYVHVLCEGRFVVSGDSSVADRLEMFGYESIKNASSQQTII